MAQLSNSDLIRRFFDGKRQYYNLAEINRSAGFNRGFLQRFLDSESHGQMSPSSVKKLLPILKCLGFYLPSTRFKSTDWID